MVVSGSKLVSMFWNESGGKTHTGNVPLEGGSLTVSIRKLDRFEMKGLKISPESGSKCLLVEGSISFKGKKYYVRYINYENGLVDWNVMPADSFSLSTSRFLDESGLGQKQFERFLRTKILPLFKNL